jgi:hypothetical protein
MKTNATDGHVLALEGQIRKDLGRIRVFIGPLMDPRPLPFRPLPTALVVVQNGRFEGERGANTSAADRQRSWVCYGSTGLLQASRIG